MAPWPFFSTARSVSPRPATTPEAINETLHTFNDDSGIDLYDSDDDRGYEYLAPPAPPFASAGPPRPAQGHKRSLSGNLNTLLAGRRRAGRVERGRPSPPRYDGAASPHAKTAKNKLNEAGDEAGLCATCATKVKWPAGVSEFRCGTCLMINDLKPSQRRPLSPKAGTAPSFSRAGTYPGTGPDRKALPLNMERTTTIINRCLDDYFSGREQTTQRPTARSPDPASQPRTDGPHAIKERKSAQKLQRSAQASAVQLDRDLLQQPPRPSARKLSSSEVTQSASIAKLRDAQARMSSKGHQNGSTHNTTTTVHSKAAPHPPSRRLLPPPMEPFSPPRNVFDRKPLPRSPGSPTKRRHENGHVTQATSGEPRPEKQSRYIFKALEDYIMYNFGNHEALNRSFSSLRPRPRVAARSEDNLKERTAAPAAAKPLAFDGYDAQIDAKTLLLGDVAENGLWWAGKQPRQAAVAREEARPPLDVSAEEIVEPKTPNIDWSTVDEWYQVIIKVGYTWRDRLATFDKDGRLDHTQLLEQTAAIEKALTQARLHVHKTLLKASESLLKRPGRPLKSPSDLRFLLIVLANPILYPAGTSPLLLDVAYDLVSTNGTASPAPLCDPQAPPKRKTEGYWEQGQTFGIIKRCLGLMSNLPNDCHRTLTSWLVRYNEDRFRALVLLVESFVTYRLTRQHEAKRTEIPTSNGLVPSLSDQGVASSAAQLHAALGLSTPAKAAKNAQSQTPLYSDDWQIKAAARVMALLFSANKTFRGERTATQEEPDLHPASISRQNIKHHGQLLSTSDFYNLKASYCDMVADFETWETAKTKFSFCQYPFFLSVGSKIRILEHDAQRQMTVKAREAFFNSILHNKDLQQYLHLKVRRECLVEDSLSAISQTVAQGEGEIKKGLRVQFVGEEGLDAGGLRKEWFLLLIREIFDPYHGMFVYDDETQLCYFNPHTFEASEQYFLVGALLGLAIYNLTILDIALPPFLFKKLLASGASSGQQNTYARPSMRYTLDDLSELHPSLARGLKQLLDYQGDVQDTYCRDFVAEVDRYGAIEPVPLCPGGMNKPVTNANRQEFVDLYVRFLLDTQVTRQFEPFKRGFFTVCGGNALSLFQPEEIELLIRGSDEPLDIPSLKAVAVYENWLRGDRKVADPAEEVNLIRWFWECLEAADPKAQRKVLSFITGSDRIPAMGATSLVIKIAFAGKDHSRYPIARTCFNLLLLYKYRSKAELTDRLWRAVNESEGFGLK